MSSVLSPSLEFVRLQEPDVVLAIMLKSFSLPTIDPLTLPLDAVILMLWPADNSSNLVEPGVVEEVRESLTETLSALKEPEFPSVEMLAAVTSSRVLLPDVFEMFTSPSADTDMSLMDPLVLFP